MAINSAISWTDHTWNVARGCHKVYDIHPGSGAKVSECEYCYMYRESMGGTRHNPEKVVQTSTKTGGTFTMPLRLPLTPAKVFTSSLTDFFHKDIDPFRDAAWDIIRRTPHLTYQILTKRPQNILSRLPADWGDGYPNVWLGVSAGYQHTADKRIPILKSIPAKVRFVSVEPLLEVVNLIPHFMAPAPADPLDSPIHWVIVGGESGNDTGDYRYRPCDLEWIANIVVQCRLFCVACWVKQVGTYQAKQLGLQHRHGANPTEWPEFIRVQEFPLI